MLKEMITSKKDVCKMSEKTMFPREEHTDMLFQKILNDPWACGRLAETFSENLVYNDEFEVSVPAHKFAESLFNAYKNRDLSALLMCLCNNTVFDLLRNSYLIPYRFNADGHTNPIIMTDSHGELLPEFHHIKHEKEYQHFREIYEHLPNKKNIFFAQAYKYSHSYDPDNSDTTQQVLVKHDGVLLIRELPDTVKQQETEAEAYSAVWDLMIKIEKELPMAYVFYGQDSLVEKDERYDEIGIFLPNSHFLKNLEKHVEKAEAIIYGN